MPYALADGRKLYYITVASSYVANLSRLHAWADRMGCQIIVLGLNHKEILKTKFQMGYKLILLQEFLDSFSESKEIIKREPEKEEEEVKEKKSSEKEKVREQREKKEPLNDNDVILYTDATDIVLNM